MISYFEKYELRNLSLKNQDKEIIALLNLMNASIMIDIDAEIINEIVQNYNEAILKEYKNLRSKYDFDSSVIQNWIIKNIKGINSIVNDRKEIILHRMRLKIIENSKKS